MKDFMYTNSDDDETRLMLEQSAADWFAENATVRHFRKQRDANNRVSSVTHWPSMTELGWPAVMIDEEAGGSGLRFSTAAVLLEHAGRHLTPSALLSTAFVAVKALSQARRSEFIHSLLQAIACGDARFALAFDDERHHAPEATLATARRSVDGWTLNGHKLAVADALSATHFLVTARIEDSGETALFVVERNSVSLQEIGLIDSREYAHVTLNNAGGQSAALLCSDASPCTLLQTTLATARVAMATEMLGIATAAFEMTLDYLKVREQFGQLIGSFQALQHRCANMYVELELLRSSVLAAQRAIDVDHPRAHSLACQSKVLAIEALHLISDESVQLHGGIGMTDEHDAGLYLKRARVCEQQFGSAGYLRRRYAELNNF